MSSHSFADAHVHAINHRSAKPDDDTRAEIERFLKTNGSRKFEPGATSDIELIIDALRRAGHVIDRRCSIGLGRAKPYTVNGKRMSHVEFLAFVNAERMKAGKEPLTIAGHV